MLANPDTRLFVHRIAEHWAESNEAPSQPEAVSYTHLTLPTKA